MRNSDPEVAASQLKTLEQFLNVHSQNIWDYIPKNIYDAIMAMQPPQFAPPTAPTKAPKETLAYKDAPEDVKREIEAQAGLQPSRMGGTTETTGPQAANETTPAPSAQNNSSATPNHLPGVSDNSKPGGTALAANQLKRPQSPMGSALDASLGRAANLPVK